MTVYKYGKKEASVILIQPVGECIREAHAYLVGWGTDCTLECGKSF